MNRDLQRARALDALRYLLAAFLAAVSLAEIYYRSRQMIFFPDEIHNLDPIVTFLRTGDYTSTSQGGHPFDPVLSSGILATWLNGLVYVAGGSLFLVRLVTALVQFGIATYLAYRLLRSRGIASADALVIALGVWTVLILVGCHDLRIMNAGELWGFLYLAAGCFLVTRSPVLAAFVWGLGTWLAKIIYLPFCLALLVALALAEALQPRGEGHATSARLGLAFVTPLLLWMALIWMRYDAGTLERWVASYLTFIAKHAADVSVTELPVYEGWSFDPNWNAMPLFRDWRDSARYLAPVVLAAAFALIYLALRLVGRIRSTLRETLLLTATCTAVAVGVVWFFAVDPTQWGRHLMPAIYVAAAVALYCAVEIYRSVATTRPAAFAFGVLAYAAVLAGGYCAYGATRTYAATEGWKISYSMSCRATALLAPPCHNGDALAVMNTLGRQWCGPDTQLFSPTDYCKVNNRRRFVEHAIDTLADADMPETTVHTAGYLIALMQAYDYDTRESFLDDLAPLVCGRPAQPLHERLQHLGIGEDVLSKACARR